MTVRDRLRSSSPIPRATLVAALLLFGCATDPPKAAVDAGPRLVEALAVRVDAAVPRDLATGPDLAIVITLRSDCPEGMAPTPGGGCIDRWEASAGKGKLGRPDGNGTTLVALSLPGMPPLVNVSYFQAQRVCKNARKHLCTEAEWLSACKGGPRNWAYPYGPRFDPGRCHDWKGSDSGKVQTVATGSYPKCVTPEGVYDLANNAGEWVMLKKDARPGKLPEARGGTYNMTIVDSSCDEDDYSAPATVTRPDIGVRCCK